MAKSIYALLDDLQTETSVPKVEDKNGNELRKTYGMVSHTLPRTGLPTADQFEDEEKLLAWAEESGVLHACLQSGIQARIIDYRAIFKAMKKDDIWTPDFGQAAVDKAAWTVTKRPKVNNELFIKNRAIYDANMKMAIAMVNTGKMEDEDIIAILTNSCGEEMAEAIIEKINSEVEDSEE
jgi:hypothetical protein